ncbi:MAG TPA: transcriptional repressor LexA [Gemmatimonadaceae bacterium]|nr:transcriptional repressor LexA [Gemmatimonadaceae bacterium]
MPEPLTQLERRVYHYMIDFLAENTYQPSIREIAKKFRIKSTKTVSDLLHALATKGYIERDESRSRGVRLLGFAAAGSTQPVPFYGKVNASEPVLAPENRAGYVTMDRRFLPAEDVFLLKVRGDALTSRCISDGDFVLVSPSTKVREGDLVAVRSGGDYAVRASTGRDESAMLGAVCAVFRPFFEKEIVREMDELPLVAPTQQVH